MIGYKSRVLGFQLILKDLYTCQNSNKKLPRYAAAKSQQLSPGVYGLNINVVRANCAVYSMNNSSRNGLSKAFISALTSKIRFVRLFMLSERGNVITDLCYFW